jgi:hypothetical protein
VEEANAMRTALSEEGAIVTDNARASEQNANARKTLNRLDVKVEKRERTVLRRRNISASCERNFRIQSEEVGFQNGNR